jgi:hypothetical protein
MFAEIIAAGIGISGKSTGHLSPLVIVLIVLAVVVGVGVMVVTRRRP